MEWAGYVLGLADAVPESALHLLQGIVSIEAERQHEMVLEEGHELRINSQKLVLVECFVLLVLAVMGVVVPRVDELLGEV